MQAKILLVKDAIAKFEDYYFTCRERNPKSETTWKGDYWNTFKRLPADELVTLNLLIDAVIATKPSSRTRRRTCMVLGAFANFLGISLDLKPYAGRYQPPKLTPRDLPDDKTVAQWFYKIPSPSWQWAYGIIATFGLRPHEVFLLDLPSWTAGEDAIQVLDGKTGYRFVYPLYPEWVETFDLRNVQCPKVSGRYHGDLGHRVAQVFRRAAVPFRCYDLRHAWAVRALEFELDITLAAQQMGHSRAIHCETYQRWINQRVHQAAFEAMVQKRDRPKPP